MIAELSLSICHETVCSALFLAPLTWRLRDREIERDRQTDRTAEEFADTRLIRGFLDRKRLGGNRSGDLPTLQVHIFYTDYDGFSFLDDEYKQLLSEFHSLEEGGATGGGGTRGRRASVL
jgi:hypothetical protein